MKSSSFSIFTCTYYFGISTYTRANEFAHPVAGCGFAYPADSSNACWWDDVPLFTFGVPSSFLIRQALDDLATGRTVLVVSFHRHILERIEQQARETPVDGNIL